MSTLSWIFGAGKPVKRGQAEFGSAAVMYCGLGLMMSVFALMCSLFWIEGGFSF